MIKKEYTCEEMMGDGMVFLFENTVTRPDPPHTHDFLELVYIRDGEGEESINGVTYQVRRGDLVFINCGSSHAFAPHGSMRYVNIGFRPELFNSLFQHPQDLSFLALTAFDEIRQEDKEGVFTFPLEERDEVEELIEAMKKEALRRASFYDLALSGYVYILLTKLARRLLAPATKQEGIWRELADYIDQNLEKPLSLGGLSQHCFYHPAYFSRIFRERFQMTLTEYISSRRVRYAAELLKDRQLSVDEVTLRCGFSSRSAFYRAFTKCMGMTPGEYREGKKTGQNT